MTFNEFSKWCKEETFDGCLSFGMVLVCCAICDDVESKPSRIRERYWRSHYETEVMEHVFNSTNKETKHDI